MNRVTSAYLTACSAPDSSLRMAGQQLPLEPAFGKVYGASLLPRPLFVAERELLQAAADVQHLHELLFQLPDRMFGGDVARLCAALGMAERPAALACAAAAAGRSPLYGRPDFYHDGTSFKLLELNSGSELGGVDWAAVNLGYLRLPEFQSFVAEQQLSYVDTGEEIAKYLRKLAEPVTEGANPVVAMIDIQSNMDTFYDNYLSFVDHMAMRGIQIKICHVRDLETRDGKLVADGTPIDVAMRYFTLEEICHEPEAEEWLAPVLRAHEEGKTVFFASLDYGIYANKGILAMVSELRQRGELSVDEAAMVDRILPWTHRVTPDVWEHCRDHREKLVLKPAAGGGGTGITVGWDVTAAEWEAAFEQALQTPHIAQERVVAAMEQAPEGDGALADWLPAWALFVFEQGYTGSWIRALPADAGAVVNLATGAQFSCAFSYPGR